MLIIKMLINIIKIKLNIYHLYVLMHNNHCYNDHLFHIYNKYFYNRLLDLFVHKFDCLIKCIK